MKQSFVQRITRHMLIIAIAATLTGCGTGDRAGSTGYQTITADLGRDTDTARRDNAKGLRLLEDEKVEQAEEAFRAALAADVSFGPAHNNLGKALYHQSKLYHAAWEFQYAIKLMPDQPEPRNNLGMVLESIGKLDDAVDRYAEARDRAPDNAQVLGNLARAKYQRGDKDDQMEELLTEVAMKDDRPEWANWARERLALDYGRAIAPLPESATQPAPTPTP